jgi:hypothetical protein
MVTPRSIAGQPEPALRLFSITIRIDCNSITNGTPPKIAVFKRDPDVLAWLFHYQLESVEIRSDNAGLFIVLFYASFDSG